MGLVYNVIHFAAESIQGSDRAASFGCQKQEAVVKTGTAPGCFILSIFFRCHGDKILEERGRIQEKR
jgi:hypothetical protein